MKLLLVRIQPRRRAGSPADTLFADYLGRCGRYGPAEGRDFASERELLAELDRAGARTSPALILTDSRGEPLSSPEFARRLGSLADAGRQQAWLVIGPADGWSDAVRARATLLLSFGRITLPHELAAVVLAEQTFRALTILAGHPYHGGHDLPAGSRTR